MNALPNADTVEKSSSGFTPTAFPEAKSSKTGVSVGYVHDDSGQRRWHVFRASYGRAERAVDYLISEGIYVYVAKQEREVVINKRVKTILVDLLPNFVFAYLSDGEARRVLSGGMETDDDSHASEAFRVASILSFYYNHCRVDSFGKNPPLTISDQQMKSFIIATSTHDQNVMLLDGHRYTFKSQDEVEVVAGKFKGVRGKVIRADRQQRILIELSDFMTFATAYVPSDFIVKSTS